MTGTGSEVTDTVDDAIEAALQPFEPLAFTVYDPLAETQKVSIQLFNSYGQKMTTVVDNEIQQAGDHYYKIKNSSLRLHAGFYLITIQAGNKKVEQKVIVL